jgi:hypothetical protein
MILRGQCRRNGEPVPVGQLHVEQDDLRPEPPGERERACRVGGLADDREPLRERRPRDGPEGGVIVDEQERPHEQHRCTRPARRRYA